MTDWLMTFRPAALAILNGGDPYQYIFNVPWVLWPLIPFAVFPEIEGIYLILFAELFALLLVGYRFTRNKWLLTIWMLNPITLFSIMVGNVEWLCLLGFIAQPVVGILLLMVKPQLTVVAIIFSLMESLYRKRRWTLSLQIVTLGCAGLYLFMGTPLLSRLVQYSSYQNTTMNVSVGLMGIPIGLFLMTVSLKLRKLGFSIVASPFLFSVVTLGCYTVVPLGIIQLMQRTKTNEP